MRSLPFAVGVVALLAAACDAGVATPVPTSPAAVTLQALSIDRFPSEFAVDAKAQLQARGAYSDGHTADVTGQVRWATLSLACLIDTAGMLTAMAEGDCDVEASLGDVKATSSVRVGASNIFTVSGVVRERWGRRSPGIRGTVTIVTGTRSGQRVTTEADGTFSLTGLPKGIVQIEAVADSYEPITVSVSPSRPTAEFMLEPVMERYARDFANPVETLLNNWTTIRLHLSRRGPVTLRLTSNRQQCEVSYFTVFSARLVTGSGDAISPCYGEFAVESREIVDPGEHVISVFTSWLGSVSGGVPTQRDLVVTYPR
jgi:hypothetical protein